MKRVILAAMAASLLVPLAATSAQASSSGSPFGALAQGPSIDAGYVVGASLKKVSSTITVPTPTCTGVDTAATFWVGLADSSLQTTARLGFDADCRSGHPTYVGWFKLLGQAREPLGRHILAGDSISLDLAATKNGLSGGFSDDTAGWGVGFITNISMHPDAAGVMASERTGTSGVRPLTNFGKAAFTNVRIDGKPINGQPVYRVVMKNRTGVVQARPSKLSAKGSFMVTWLHA